jgi:transcription initiation factor IIE alpha subunit
MSAKGPMTLKSALLPTNEILQYLKKHGERSDKEIADALCIRLADLHIQLAVLKDKNQIMLC